MKRTIIIILILLNVAATFIYSQGLTTPEKGKALVYFVRLMGWKIDLFHQDKCIGNVSPNQYLTYSCSPGTQLFWASYNNIEFLTADLKEGCSYLVLVRPVTGFIKTHVELLPLTAANEEFFTKAKKLIDKKKPNTFSESEINEKNVKLESFIKDNLTKYDIEWKGVRHFKNISEDMCLPISEFNK